MQNNKNLSRSRSPQSRGMINQKSQIYIDMPVHQKILFNNRYKDPHMYSIKTENQRLKRRLLEIKLRKNVFKSSSMSVDYDESKKLEKYHREKIRQQKKSLLQQENNHLIERIMSYKMKSKNKSNNLSKQNCQSQKSVKKSKRKQRKIVEKGSVNKKPRSVQLPKLSKRRKDSITIL